MELKERNEQKYQWRRDNIEHRRAYEREYYNKKNRETRNMVFDHYGRQCVCCGESCFFFLTIDHIDNNGAEHRKQIGQWGAKNFYQWLRRNNFPEGFQTMCYNCNLGKNRNGVVCPHKQTI